MIQHSEIVGPGTLAILLNDHGLQARIVKPYLGDDLPAVTDFDLLILLGGPMGVYEEAEHPWLIPEKALVRAAVAGGKKVLGICLGAQMLSEVMGGRVRRAEHMEAGWHEVRLTEGAKRSTLFRTAPPAFQAFEWHQDTFTAPPGTESVMATDGCANQAFEFEGRIAAVQFHPEITEELYTAWQARKPLTPGPHVKSLKLQAGVTQDDTAYRVLRELIQALTE